MLTRLPAQWGQGQLLWSRKLRSVFPCPMETSIPGTRMAFAGVRDPKEVEDLWAYLKQFGADGQKK